MATSFAEIVRAGLAVAGRDGLGAVSMRAVGAELGLTAMALYRHVPGKEALLDGMVGALLSEIELLPDGEPWPERLRQVALELFSLSRRYPTVVPLLLTRPYKAPEAVRVVRAMYRILADARVASGEIYRIERLISTQLLGYCVSVSNHAFWAADPATLAVESAPDEPPNPNTWEDRWKIELEQNLDSLRRLIESEQAPG